MFAKLFFNVFSRPALLKVFSPNITSYCIISSMYTGIHISTSGASLYNTNVILISRWRVAMMSEKTRWPDASIEKLNVWACLAIVFFNGKTRLAIRFFNGRTRPAIEIFDGRMWKNSMARCIHAAIEFF